VPTTTPHNMGQLNTLRDKLTALLGPLNLGPSTLTFIMSGNVPATRLDVHSELARLEDNYLAKVPELARPIMDRLREIDVDLVPLTPEQRTARIAEMEASLLHVRTAVYKLRYLFETGLPIGNDWRAIKQELEASITPFRQLSRDVDTWVRNLNLGRTATGQPGGVPGGVPHKPGPQPKDEEPKPLTPEQKTKLREEMERRRHLPFAEQLRLSLQDYEAMAGIYRKLHPKPEPAQKPEDVDIAPEEFEVDDDGRARTDRWGRPIKKEKPPTTPEEFARREQETDKKFDSAQERWVRRVVNKLDSMSKFTRLNHLLEADEPFGIFLASLVVTKYTAGKLALQAVRQAKGVIGARTGTGYLVIRNVPVIGVRHGEDPQPAMKILSESTSRVLDKQRRWARFWFVASTRRYYEGHDYYVLWPKTLGDDVHKLHVEQWDFNLRDQSNADAGTKE